MSNYWQDEVEIIDSGKVDSYKYNEDETKWFIDEAIEYINKSDPDTLETIAAKKVLLKYQAMKINNEKRFLPLNKVHTIFSRPDIIDEQGNISKMGSGSYIFWVIITIIAIIFGVITGLIIVYVIIMLITLPFAINNEKLVGKFKFTRFAKNVLLGPVFAVRYTIKDAALVLSENKEIKKIHEKHMAEIRTKGEFA